MTSGTFPYIWVYDYMIILTGIYFYYFTDPQSNIHIVTEWIANDVSATKIRYKITVVLLSKNTYRNDPINYLYQLHPRTFLLMIRQGIRRHFNSKTRGSCLV